MIVRDNHVLSFGFLTAACRLLVVIIVAKSVWVAGVHLERLLHPTGNVFVDIVWLQQLTAIVIPYGQLQIQTRIYLVLIKEQQQHVHDLPRESWEAGRGTKIASIDSARAASKTRESREQGGGTEFIDKCLLNKEQQQQQPATTTRFARCKGEVPRLLPCCFDR